MERRLYDLIWRLMLTQDKEERIKYGDLALKELENIKKETVKKDAVIDNLTYKLADVSKKLCFAEKWREYLYEALGKDLNLCVRKALLIKQKRERK